MFISILRKYEIYFSRLKRFIYGKRFLYLVVVLLMMALFKIYMDILSMEEITRALYKMERLDIVEYEKTSLALSIKDFEKMYINSIKIEIGNGDLGKNVELNKTEKKLSKKRFEENEFDVVVSDKIPLLRRLPEKRQSICFSRKYPTNLPKFDVIITFYNEAYSTLMRTIHSVLSRSPPDLLNEIILIDDFSNESRQDYLKIKSEIIKLNKLKYIRNQKNEGLIKTRQKGAESAKADIIIFLDSHCECFNGWVEPLLADIVEHPNNIIVPIIISIDDKKFTISQSVENSVHIGTITSRLSFNWLLNDQSNETEYKKKSPAMAGGLYAVDRKLFFKLGGYDIHMTTWGGENVEFSLRTWMCGGEIYIDVCSIVGHVFRAKSPYLKNGYDYKNDLRTAEVWLDDYKKLFLRKINRTGLKNGDKTLGPRFKIKKDLKCKSFKWYLKNVYIGPKLYANEYQLMHTKSGECLALSGPNTNNNGVTMKNCSDNDRDQKIEYDSKSLFVHWYHLTFSYGDYSLKTILHQRIEPVNIWIIKDNKIYNQNSNKYIKYQHGILSLDSCTKDIDFCKWNVTLKQSFD